MPSTRRSGADIERWQRSLLGKRVAKLVREYADVLVRGDRPTPVDYLPRAGADPTSSQR